MKLTEEQMAINRLLTGNTAHSCKADYIKLAIKALEKQVPKKVIVPPCNTCENELCDCECEYFTKTFVGDFRCSTCGSEKVYMLEYDIRHDCCPNCGQRLDWSEV